MRSTIGDLNKYKQSWKTREDINSTIKSLDKKIKALKKKKAKANLSDIPSISNDIKYYDHLLYEIKLNYYEILTECSIS